MSKVLFKPAAVGYRQSLPLPLLQRLMAVAVATSLALLCALKTQADDSIQPITYSHARNATLNRSGDPATIFPTHRWQDMCVSQPRDGQDLLSSLVDFAVPAPAFSGSTVGIQNAEDARIALKPSKDLAAVLVSTANLLHRAGTGSAGAFVFNNAPIVSGASGSDDASPAIAPAANLHKTFAGLDRSAGSLSIDGGIVHWSGKANDAAAGMGDDLAGAWARDLALLLDGGLLPDTAAWTTLLRRPFAVEDASNLSATDDSLIAILARSPRWAGHATITRIQSDPSALAAAPSGADAPLRFFGILLPDQNRTSYASHSYAGNQHPSMLLAPPGVPTATSALSRSQLSGQSGGSVVGGQGAGVTPDNNTIALEVNVLTGDVMAIGNNAAGIGGLDIKSALLNLIGANAVSSSPAFFTPFSASNSEISYSHLPKSTLNTSVDLGRIFRTNRSQDLTFSYAQNGQTIPGTLIVYDGAPTSMTWTGLTDGTGAANSNWSTSVTLANWASGIYATHYAEGVAVTFQDTNTVSNTSVTNPNVLVQAGGVSPSSVIFNNATVTYTISNAGGSVGITGATGITKNNSGTENLADINTYTGSTTINAGTLNVAALADVNTASSIGKGSSLGSAADLIFGGGTLQYTSAAPASTNRLFTLGNASGLSGTLDSSAALPANALSFTASGPIALGGAGARTLILTGSNTGANTFLPILGDGAGGATGLTKNGAGAWLVTGANTYTGPTVVNAGTLTVGVASAAGSGALGNNSAVTLANAAGASLNLNNFDTQIGSLTGGGAAGGNVSLGTAALIVGGDNTSPAAYAGTISGAGSLTKIGTGTLALAAANTHSGGTTINGGTLLANNATGSATGSGNVIVNAGVLAGTGTINATGGGASVVTLNSGATLSAGNGRDGSAAPATTGLLTINTTGASGTTLTGSSTGSTYLWKINDAGLNTASQGAGLGTAGSSVGWDKVSMTLLSVAAGTGSNPGVVTVKPISLSANGLQGAMGNLDIYVTYKWIIAHVSGAGATFNASNFVLDTSALTTFASANRTDTSLFSIGTANADTDLVITYDGSSAPEPTSLLLALTAVMPMLLARRRLVTPACR